MNESHFLAIAILALLDIRLVLIFLPQACGSEALLLQSKEAQVVSGVLYVCTVRAFRSKIFVVLARQIYSNAQNGEDQESSLLIFK